jgi:hypothetical protein
VYRHRSHTDRDVLWHCSAMSARVADRLWPHFWEAAAAAGVSGARGRVCSMCLVVEAADLLESAGIAKTRVAIRSQRSWG